jgi:hypothetical protein
VALSLTKDELLSRFAQQHKLFEVALKHDLEGGMIPREFFTEAVVKVLASLLMRTIDLAYREE